VPDINDPATLVADVQLLFSAKVDGVLVLDMIALDGLVWSTGRLTRNSPFTMAVVEPPGAELDEIAGRWADRCAVLEMTLVDAEHWEIVFLDGPDEQILLELPKGRLAGGA
jgi:hypothetical protein